MSATPQPNTATADHTDNERSAESSAPDQKCVSIIFNPVSGQTDPEARKKSITDALTEHGYTCIFIETSKEVGGEELAKKAISDGVDLIAVSGGDGTVIEVLSAAIGSDIPIAVLPAGTGNLLSVNLGIPATVPEAVHVALSGQPYQLDLGRSNDGKHFAIMGGLGLDARMINDADREAKKRLGVFAYLWAALKNLPRRGAYVEIVLDGRPPIRSRAKSVLIANMGKVTGGLEAMPTASPNDGLLDVGVIKAETLGQWLRIAGYALIGRAHDAPDLDVYQAKKISVRTPNPEPIEFDGESGGDTREWNVEVVPRCVSVLLPEGGPAAMDASETPEAVARRSFTGLAIGAGVLLAIALVVVNRRRR
ncbi:diacylglycerol kinase [Capsulimonas corticalis]|uniref:Diacylglycerol kinase n=1 Tax=Capsulimonas corticalis TaxID=2219043 RepID=A0A402CTN6_9BACT|nr:diacylglycerol kinase family protein [Capsulimonas corticalis]BDI30668.1 diacylglycerol kinase [Capsulimonas corticalis]